MAGKPILFHSQAAAEYEAAFDWYFEPSELAASRFSMELETALEMISEGPHRWPNYSHGTRKFVLQRFPFIVIYRELPSSIQVLAAAHGHRRPGYWRKRLHSDK
jgi:plasmid stabilization system protein ParE